MNENSITIAQGISTRPVTRDSITVFLMDAGGLNDPPYDARLKQALKCLGRRFKLRVRSMASGNQIKLMEGQRCVRSANGTC